MSPNEIHTDPFDRAETWLDEGLDVAVATVVATWGSSPRGPGSVMCMNARGEFVGSVSGGCVETAVVDEARQVLETGHAKLLEYGVTNDDAWEVGLACGGTVQVRVERVRDRGDLDRTVPSPARGTTRVVATDLDSGERASFDVARGVNGTVTVTPESPDDTWDPDVGARVLESAGQAAVAGRSSVAEIGGRRIFLHLLAPPVRVLVVGAVHIAQSLVAMVRAAGFDPVVVDPRTAFATPERFPGVRLVHAWPAEAFEKLDLDDRTAVVALTHDPKLDDPALTAALSSDVFYIGALGSRSTHARRVERLRTAGVEPERLDRLHAPIGLDIGARTPGEIAAAILAEIVRELRVSEKIGAP